MKLLYYIFGVLALIGCIIAVFGVIAGFSGIMPVCNALVCIFGGTLAYTVFRECMKDIDDLNEKGGKE